MPCSPFLLHLAVASTLLMAPLHAVAIEATLRVPFSLSSSSSGDRAVFADSSRTYFSPAATAGGGTLTLSVSDWGLSLSPDTTGSLVSLEVFLSSTDRSSRISIAGWSGTEWFGDVTYTGDEAPFTKTVRSYGAGVAPLSAFVSSTLTSGRANVRGELTWRGNSVADPEPTTGLLIRSTEGTPFGGGTLVSIPGSDTAGPFGTITAFSGSPPLVRRENGDVVLGQIGTPLYLRDEIETLQGEAEITFGLVGEKFSVPPSAKVGVDFFDYSDSEPNLSLLKSIFIFTGDLLGSFAPDSPEPECCGPGILGIRGDAGLIPNLNPFEVNKGALLQSASPVTLKTHFQSDSSNASLSFEYALLGDENAFLSVSIGGVEVFFQFADDTQVGQMETVTLDIAGLPLGGLDIEFTHDGATGSEAIIDNVRLVGQNGDMIPNGDFSSFDSGWFIEGEGNASLAAIQTTEEQVLVADYNNDGVVDPADYSVWRDNAGNSAGSLANDPIGGIIGDRHYNLWVANYGNSITADASQTPEPNAFITLAIACLTCLTQSRNRFS